MTFDEWADGLTTDIDRMRWPWQRQKRADLRKILAAGTAAQRHHEENMRRYWEKRKRK